MLVRAEGLNWTPTAEADLGRACPNVGGVPFPLPVPEVTPPTSTSGFDPSAGVYGMRWSAGDLKTSCTVLSAVHFVLPQGT